MIARLLAHLGGHAVVSHRPPHLDGYLVQRRYIGWSRNAGVCPVAETQTNVLIAYPCMGHTSCKHQGQHRKTLCFNDSYNSSMQTSIDDICFNDHYNPYIGWSISQSIQASIHPSNEPSNMLQRSIQSMHRLIH